jgi:hypothetical protein
MDGWREQPGVTWRDVMGCGVADGILFLLSSVHCTYQRMIVKVRYHVKPKTK